MAKAKPEVVQRSTRMLASWLLLPCSLALTACSEPPAQTLHFARGSAEAVVTFGGEVDDDALFDASASLLQKVQPLDESGRPRGAVLEARPGWLRFTYQVDGVRREVLLAKRPLMNNVSWDDIARAGAASALPPRRRSGPASAPEPSGARLTSPDGHQYLVRLPTCGQSTFDALSEWNLLVGAVHRGDMDFVGRTYGWISQPYDDEDLKVGLHGTLTWCLDARGLDRVARGYFFVSRFHSAPPHIRTDRLGWRPVLERIEAAAAGVPPEADASGRPVAWSPSGRVGFAGVVSNSELFGPEGRIDALIKIEVGQRLEGGQPDWLRFLHNGRTLLVAAKPVRLSLSWDSIARAGAALGDGSQVRQGWRFYAQNAEVRGLDGNRYRVRLLDCGSSTLDIGSEWNALLGGVHRGDGDFVPYPAGVHGWLRPPFDDRALHIGFEHASATWCRNTLKIDGDLYGVNRGFLTISRFHATQTGFGGTGFAWRPVLELIR